MGKEREIIKKYKCKQCGNFIGELADDGCIIYNPKNKFASNGVIKKITCSKCNNIILIKD